MLLSGFDVLNRLLRGEPISGQPPQASGLVLGAGILAALIAVALVVFLASPRPQAARVVNPSAEPTPTPAADTDEPKATPGLARYRWQRVSSLDLEEPLAGSGRENMDTFAYRVAVGEIALRQRFADDGDSGTAGTVEVGEVTSC